MQFSAAAVVNALNYQPANRTNCLPPDDVLDESDSFRNWDLKVMCVEENYGTVWYLRTHTFLY